MTGTFTLTAREKASPPLSEEPGSKNQTEATTFTMTSAKRVSAAIRGALTTRHSVEQERARDRRSVQLRERGRKRLMEMGAASSAQQGSGVGMSDCQQLQVDLKCSCRNRKTGGWISPTFEADKPIRVLMTHWM